MLPNLEVIPVLEVRSLVLGLGRLDQHYFENLAELVQIAFEAGFAKVVVELEVLVLQVAVYPPECTYLYEVVLYMKGQQHFDLVFEVFVLS